MPTITTLIGVMVVIGLGLAILLLFVKALANLASRTASDGDSICTRGFPG